MKYIGDTGKRLENRFHEQLRVVNTTWQQSRLLTHLCEKFPDFLWYFALSRRKWKSNIFQIGSFALPGIQEIISLNDIILAFSGVMFHLTT